MTSRVTVGLPFFNNAGTILDAVRSVFAQHHQDWTLLLVDDGSTDGSVGLLRQISDSRVRILSDGRNLGLATRLNQIAATAESPLLARMDADDLMHPARMQRQLAAFDDRSLDLVFSAAVAIDADGEPTGYRRSLPEPTVLDHFRRSPYIHPTLLGRTTWFRSHPYDATFRRCQDQELWVRTIDDRAVEVIDSPLLYLREAGTVSATKYASSMNGTRAVLRLHGRERLGAGRARRIMASSFAKQIAYAAAERVRQTDRIVRSRSESLSASARADHTGVISHILGTPLPGIDS